MVSVWLTAIPAIMMAFFAFFTPWTMALYPNGLPEVTLAPTDMASAMGDAYGPCGCPPWAGLSLNVSQGMGTSEVQDLALEAMVPALVSVTFLAAGA